MSIKKLALPIALALSAATLAGCGSSVQCTSSAFESRVFSQQVTDRSVTLVKAASIKADGGQYVAASFRMVDGGTSKAVWYITDDGTGSITRVGKVTALISGGANSEKVGITVGSQGFKDVQGCV